MNYEAGSRQILPDGSSERAAIPTNDYGLDVKLHGCTFRLGAWYDVKPGHYDQPHGASRQLEVLLRHGQVWVLTRNYRRIKPTAWTTEDWVKWAGEEVPPP